MNESLTFDVSSLFNAGIGTTEIYNFDGPAEFEGLNLKSNIKGQLEVMKMEDSLNCKVSNIDTSVELICDLCLKKFTESIHIEIDERQYHFYKPEVIDDPNDIFLVNIKKQEIDLTEPLRQEIILHFPELPVCYKGCKGICHICGIDKNEESCDCKDELPEEHKPLSALKSLLKKNNNG